MPTASRGSACLHEGIDGSPPDPAQDLDWDKWSFCAALASYFAGHCQLRDDWAGQGICIKALVHHQCFVRYVLAQSPACSTAATAG